MVNYQDHLPLEWVPGAAAAVDDRQRRTTNLYVLEAVAAVEDRAPDHLHEEQPELHSELQRIDAKLQLLMDMVARLLRRDEQFPERYAVRIAVELIEVMSGLPGMTPGSEGVLYLHLHPAIPAPLLLPGRITDKAEDGEELWMHFTPMPLSESENEAFARHVFRHHRRGIAASRQGGPLD